MLLVKLISSLALCRAIVGEVSLCGGKVESWSGVLTRCHHGLLLIVVNNSQEYDRNVCMLGVVCIMLLRDLKSRRPSCFEIL